MPELRKYNLFENKIVHVGRLTNGLTVCLHPRQEFYETFGMMTIDFGSIDATFYSKTNKQIKTFPAGIAHFLEHKMFEMEEEKDALESFFFLGANANAFTSHCQTSYVFSTIQEPYSALHLLQEVLSKICITDQSVAKEKEIIAQEIQMYKDDPDLRLYNEILASLYPGTPLGEDIAGSLSSIKGITADMLRENFSYFYQPQQMTLLLAGNFEVEKVWEHLLAYQMTESSVLPKAERKMIELFPVLEKRSLTLDIAIPKLALGIRSKKVSWERGLQHYKACLNLFFAMLLSWTSEHYQTLYEEGKIDSSFRFDVEVQPEYQFLIVTVDTKEPIALSSQFKKIIYQFEKDATFSVEHLELIKREAYGDYLKHFNSLESVITYLSSVMPYEEDFHYVRMLEAISLDDVLAAGRAFLEESDATDVIIFPK